MPGSKAGKWWLGILLVAWPWPSSQATTADSSSSNSSGYELPGVLDPASEHLVHWLKSNGAEINFAVRAVEGMGRGVYAPKPFEKGDVLARIPVEMLWANHDLKKPEELAAVELLTEMAKTDSPWKPWWDALPGPSDVMIAQKMPVSYFPIIQHPWTESGIKSAWDRVQALWDKFGKAHWEALGLTREDITHGAALLQTRAFGFPTANLMVPAVDMTNHDDTCLHTTIHESCDPTEGLQQWQTKTQPPLSIAAGSGVFGPAAQHNSSGQCMVYRAGSAVAAGQSLCLNYGVAPQDRMVLQYGFLQTGRGTELLSLMDKPSPDKESYYAEFHGNLAATWAEIDRLASILTHLRGGEDAAAAVQVNETADPGGAYLTMLKTWRRQRMAAVQAELRRLYLETHKLTAGFERWMSAEVEGAAEAITEAQLLAAGQACSACAGGADTAAATADGTSLIVGADAAVGVFHRVLKAVNPWYEM